MGLGDELQGQATHEQDADQDTNADRLAASHRAFRPRYFAAIDVRSDRLRPKGRKRDGAPLGDPDLVPLCFTHRQLVVGRCPD